MKIYTKTGDGGDTGLFGGARVPKDNVRVAAYGDVDELNAAIGMARALDPAAFADELLQTVQRALFTIGAELATPDAAARAKALARSGAPLAAADVGVLEDAIDSHTAQLAPLTAFILPGGTPKAAALHGARTVCRRAERAVVTLSRAAEIRPTILQYLNRLSDLLFVLARAANAQADRPDVRW